MFSFMNLNIPGSFGGGGEDAMRVLLITINYSGTPPEGENEVAPNILTP